MILLKADADAITTISAALPSDDVPADLTEETPGTCRTACSTWPIAAVSVAVSGPDARVATMIAVLDGSVARNGAASWLACTLGLDDDRNCTLLDWVTLDRLGSRRAAATTPAIQTTTISQRNRTSNRAMAANMVHPLVSLATSQWSITDNLRAT